MLYRVIKHVQDTKNRKLILSPSKEGLYWNLKAYTDSDYAGDADNRKSVSGFMIYVNGCLIAWKSKGQKSVTLSSTKAEYVAILEVSTEILFIAGVMKFLDLEITYPIEINVDNIGAIYLSKNATTGNWTKNVDTRYHIIWEYIKKGIVKIVFVHSEDIKADLIKKSRERAICETHKGDVWNLIFDSWYLTLIWIMNNSQEGCQNICALSWCTR